MKNATKYQKKLKKLLAGMDNSPQAPPADIEPLSFMIRAILEANAGAKLAEKAVATLNEEYVDVNELRVSPPKEIVDCLGRNYPESRRKAAEITSVLQALYLRRNELSLGDAAKMTKRDLRRHLAELGLSPYPAACMMLHVYDGHAVPVDETLVECLEMDGYIEPGSSLDDVQGFLERVINQKNALAAHERFREYVVDSAPALARKRKVEAEAAAKAEQEAQRKAQEEARKQAEAQAEAERKKAERDAAAKDRKRRKSAKARSRKTGRKAAEQAAQAKAAKKGAEPSSARTRGKAKTSAKTSAKKPARKAARKGAK
ncbi:MAG TPA: hypothetical protein VM695_04210 [Phycisphaerae bacterium]|nr:hypothetical protein [Phycisphaerae bacterium]